MLRTGTTLRDTLTGTAGNDEFFGLDGNDVIYGNGGNDLFDGGLGDDRMVAGAGADTMLGGAGNDTAYAGGGNDWVAGGEGSDLIYAGAGNDTVYGDAEGMLAAPGIAYDDLIEAGTGNDLVFGGLGSDEIQGEAGNDTISGGKDNGKLVFATTETCLDKAIAFKGGDAVTFDLKSVTGAGGSIKLVYEGVAHTVATGAIGAKVGAADWTTFCSQLPESIGFGATKGFALRGADEAFSVSDNLAVSGKPIPTPETVTRDLALERAQVLLAQDLFGDLGFDACGIRGFVNAGKQDQIGVEGTAKLTGAQGSAAQLLMWEIAYDFDGTLGSIDLGAGRLSTDTKAMNAEVLKTFKSLLGGLSLDGLVSPAKDPAHPLSVSIGDNLYGNDGSDTFRFAKGDGVDLVWDFQAGTDIIEVTGYKSTDVDAFTFVAGVTNLGRDGANPLDAGSHQKLAIILDTSGDAILFNDLGNRASTAAAVKFDDRTMSVSELLAKAMPATAAVAPAAASGDEVSAAIAVTNSWWGGFQAEITVTAKAALADWDVLLGTKWNVGSVWGAQQGATTVAVGGKLIDLNDADWNGHLAAGQTATIGFTAETGFAGVMSAQAILDGMWIG